MKDNTKSILETGSKNSNILNASEKRTHRLVFEHDSPRSHYSPSLAVSTRSPWNRVPNSLNATLQVVRRCLQALSVTVSLLLGASLVTEFVSARPLGVLSKTCCDHGAGHTLLDEAGSARGLQGCGSPRDGSKKCSFIRHVTRNRAAIDEARI